MCLKHVQAFRKGFVRQPRGRRTRYSEPNWSLLLDLTGTEIWKNNTVPVLVTVPNTQLHTKKPNKETCTRFREVPNPVQVQIDNKTTRQTRHTQKHEYSSK